MSLRKVFEVFQYWSYSPEPADATAAIAAMTADEDREVIGMLDEYAARCPLDGPLSAQPWTSPIGNSFRPVGSEPFMKVGYTVGRRATPDGLAALRRLFAEHPSREVRLASGRYLLLSPGHAELVAEGALAFAREALGWTELWADAQLAISKADAFVPIADFLATAAPSPAQITAILHAAWRAGVDDRRWLDLAVDAQTGTVVDGGQALLVLLRDRRAIPHLVWTLGSTMDLGTIDYALRALMRIVEGEELVELVREPYEQTTNRYAYESILEHHPAGRVLVERRRAQRLAALAAKQYRYRFFGAAPADWYEGANGGHLYLVRFAGVLDDAAAAKVVKAVARQKFAGPWSLAELDGSTWAMFRRGGKPLSPDNKVLPAIHKAAPIAEVIFGGVREPDEERDDWSFWSEHAGGKSPRAPQLPGVDTRLVYYLRGRELVPVAWRTLAL